MCQGQNLDDSETSVFPGPRVTRMEASCARPAVAAPRAEWATPLQGQKKDQLQAWYCEGFPVLSLQSVACDVFIDSIGSVKFHSLCRFFSTNLAQQGSLSFNQKSFTKPDLRLLQKQTCPPSSIQSSKL